MRRRRTIPFTAIDTQWRRSGKRFSEWKRHARRWETEKPYGVHCQARGQVGFYPWPGVAASNCNSQGLTTMAPNNPRPMTEGETAQVALYTYYTESVPLARSQAMKPRGTCWSGILSEKLHAEPDHPGRSGAEGGVQSLRRICRAPIGYHKAREACSLQRQNVEILWRA